MRITERNAKSAAIPSEGQALYFDDDVKGFGVRVTSKGGRSWIVEVRRRSRSQRITIGPVAEISAAEARARALGINLQRCLGALFRRSARGPFTINLEARGKPNSCPWAASLRPPETGGSRRRRPGSRSRQDPRPGLGKPHLGGCARHSGPRHQPRMARTYRGVGASEATGDPP
jgi:hypothetical protein